MKSSWRSPDGGSSGARNTKIESCGAVFCARWGTGSTPIRSFHTVSEGVFSEVRGDGVLRSSVTSRAAAAARAALTPRRFLAGRIDHLGLPCDYRAQNFLLLRLGYIEVVERTADLRSNLVELFRTDMEVLVGFVQLPAREDLHISSEEFDEVGAEIGRAL